MAEVSVKVTAKNEVKTGFQAALNDAKKFGQDASKAATPDIGGSDSSGKGFRNAIKGLGADLASASSPAEAFQAVATRIAGVFGKVTSVVAGFAIGKIISGQIDQMSESVKSATAAMNAFGDAYQSAATANSFEDAIAGYQKLGAQIDRVKASIGEIQGSMLPAFFNWLSGGATTQQLEAAQQSLQVARESALSGALYRQRAAAESMTGLGGDKAAIEAKALQSKRAEQLAIIQAKIDQNPNNPMFRNQMEDLVATYAAEDKVKKEIEDRQALEKQLQKEQQLKKQMADEEAAFFKEAARLTEERARQGKSTPELLDIERAKLAKLDEQAITAPVEELNQVLLDRMKQGNLVSGLELKAQEEAQRAAEQTVAGVSQKMIGSSGASALQRIGFASSEFYDTRRKASPEEMAKEIRRNADYTKEVRDILKKGEPLVLQPTSS